MRAVRGAARPPMIAALALLALVPACNGASDQALWRDDFETLCDGVPCGWSQVAGPAGAVTYVETAPSEHGLQMRGDGVAISRTADGDEVLVPAMAASMRAHVVARCDAGSQITAIVTVRNLTGGLPIDVSGVATYPSTWDGTRTTFDLFVTDSGDRDAQYDDILGVVLHKEGPGVCEVDYVSLADDNVPFFE